ncbi:MAG: MATE family efflux transporter [Rhodospirillales bacterium]|nr:MATE family efflux transporter [Rhodospirillales bacterium]
MTRPLSYELKQTLIIAAPLAGAYMAEVAMIMIDHMMVGRLGSLELAAAGLLGDVALELLLFGTAVVSIVGVLVAHSRGAEKAEQIGHHVAQGLWVAFALGILITILCWFVGDILAPSGQDPRVIEVGQIYVDALSWGILPGILFIALRAYTSAMSRAMPVLVITVLAVAIKIPVTYVMVFGGFGVPQLGVAGAGWATAIATWGMLIALGGYVTVAKGLKEHQVFSHLLEFDWREVLQIFRLGLPLGGIAMLEGGMFMAIGILMGLFGPNALAANQAVFGWMGITFVVTLALGEAASIRIAHELGASKPREARRAGLLAVGMGTLVMCGTAIIFILLPRLLTSAFLDLEAAENGPVLDLAMNLFLIAALFQFSDGLQAIATRMLRGMRDTLVPMWIASLGYWVFGVGGGWMLAFPLGYGPAGLWWGLAWGLSVTGGMLLWRFNRLSKAVVDGKRPDLLDAVADPITDPITNPIANEGI